jgi:Tfp pilus assembly protein PilX
MSMTLSVTGAAALRRLRRRLADERGFTMIVAIGVLAIVSMLTAALLLTVNNDVGFTKDDLNGKQAYAAAQAGVQAYLYNLNNNSTNSSWWETCSNDTVSQTAVPDSTTGATYSYAPVPANGNTTCLTTNPVGSLIDNNTGTLRLKFTGYSGTQTRTIVASFRTLSPLSFLWYTVYETVDTSIDSTDNCDRFYYQSPGPGSACDIYWVTGDHMYGPMYTQDQFMVESGNSPTFGRNAQDDIASQAPTRSASAICAGNNCQNASVLGTAEPDVTPQVPLPSDNSNLLSDAQNHGVVYTGTVTLRVNGGTATGWNCTTSSSSSCTALSINLTTDPIIYATNASGCNSTYNPTSISYPTVGSGSAQGAYYGPCGDIYISGTYSAPLTIAAGDDVIVTGNLVNSTDSNPTGTAQLTGGATLGLVANQYVRVMHTCSGNPNVTIDGAILTLEHSFFVDNYSCGGMPQGTLSVHGAIAQKFRGIVGTVGASGYLKNYNYDDRLQLILPPYLFDLQNTEWTVFRETLCSSTSSSNPSSCSA